MSDEISTDILRKKKVSRKNEVKRELSACVIRKFNGYEILRKDLQRKESKNFKPIDITYEPSFERDVPVLCHFAPQIHLAYRSYIGLFKNGVEKISNRTVKQCHYCDNFFAKTDEKMNQHISVCSAKQGITYSFDNAQIIDYQDNYKYMGDLPFSVYFDFETTTGDAVFFHSKMYVVSYCMIVSFNKSLNFDKMVIFRSYQQTAVELYDISHFKHEHVPFFDQLTLRQLKDAASAVAFREKCTSLAEMFSIELKFTIDTLKLYFNNIINPRFTELEYIHKNHFKDQNPFTEDTLCCICNFLVSTYVENGWLDHVLKAEHLFLRNIYDNDQMKKNENR